MDESQPIKPMLKIIRAKNIKRKLNIVNKGTGAGGSNTNKTGLSYEDITALHEHIIKVKTCKNSNDIVFRGNDLVFKMTKKAGLFKCMHDKINNEIQKAHGCKNPDECYINEDSKTMFIIEKKFQQTPGSVCEKIQTHDFKIWQYSRTFPDYKIVYMYCLSDWFKDNCKAELEYAEVKNVPIFWGNTTTYKEDVIKFMINYK